MTDNQNPSRQIIFDLLYAILESDQYSHLALAGGMAKYQYLSKQDRSFIKRVTNGTVEYRIPIDYMLDHYSKVKVSRMKPVIRTILRMAVYQICYMDRVPDSAACNEAVKLTKEQGLTGLKGFVNGVLRNLVRGKETFCLPSDSVRLCLPEWMYELFVREQGRETAAVMAESFLKDSPLTVRLNTTFAARETILDSLKAQGVETVPSDFSKGVLLLKNVDFLEQLEAFQKGYIQVQDLSSALLGDAAGIQEGDRVLDVCGAPGGKAIHAAELLKRTGMVTVRDKSSSKVLMINDNIDRSGFHNIKAEVFDALTYDPQWDRRADVVLADLPCSGLGVIGRKPDIRYRMTPEKIRELSLLQQNILSVVQNYVRPGGTLVYSTCTIDRQENEDNLSWFLEHYPFEAADITGRLAEGLSNPSMKKGYLKILPGLYPCDGFFIAVMRRKNE